MLQGCLNGARPADAHPALPVTPDAFARDAGAMARYGITSVHIHPRCPAGLETLEPRYVGEAVAAVHAEVSGIEVGVPAARWVEPDWRARVRAVVAWGRLGTGTPDVIAVNVHDKGWREICAAAHSVGMGVELGVWTTGDAVTVRNAGLPPGIVRLVAEPTVSSRTVVVAEAIRLLRTLGDLGVPVLVHGEDTGAWPVFDHARQEQLPTRIGLEDTLQGRDGWLVMDNEDLIEVALGIEPTPKRRRIGRGIW